MFLLIQQQVEANSLWSKVYIKSGKFMKLLKHGVLLNVLVEKSKLLWHPPARWRVVPQHCRTMLDPKRLRFHPAAKPAQRDVPAARLGFCISSKHESAQIWPQFQQCILWQTVRFWTLTLGPNRQRHAWSFLPWVFTSSTVDILSCELNKHNEMPHASHHPYQALMQ